MVLNLTSTWQLFPSLFISLSPKDREREYSVPSPHIYHVWHALASYLVCHIISYHTIYILSHPTLSHTRHQVQQAAVSSCDIILDCCNLTTARSKTKIFIFRPVKLGGGEDPRRETVRSKGSIIYQLRSA